VNHSRDVWLNELLAEIRYYKNLHHWIFGLAMAFCFAYFTFSQSNDVLRNILIFKIQFMQCFILCVSTALPVMAIVAILHYHGKIAHLLSDVFVAIPVDTIFDGLREQTSKYREAVFDQPYCKRFCCGFGHKIMSATIFLVSVANICMSYDNYAACMTSSLYFTISLGVLFSGIVLFLWLESMFPFNKVN
jgi:hypothetical protein